jgi:hypothetical protein
MTEWSARLDDRRRALGSPATWTDDVEILDAEERQVARELVQDAPGTVDQRTAVEIVQTPRRTNWVNPYEALLDEVRRTNAYVVLLEVEVTEWDAQGGAHRHKGGRSVLARYERERDRLITVCKTAIGLGIAERQVRIAERQGEMLASVAVAAVDKAHVTPEQKSIILGELAAQLRAGIGYQQAIGA